MNEGRRLDGPIKTTPPKPRPILLLVRFYECEHDGDLGNYIDCCFAAGATNLSVIETKYNSDETALIQVTTMKDRNSFKATLEQTSAAGLNRVGQGRTT